MDCSSSSKLEEEEEEEEESSLFALQLVTATVLPAALKASIELDLLELIKKAGPGAFVSPVELAAQITTTNTEAPVMLDRILRILAANNILNCRLTDLPDGGVERLYSLAPVCNYFTRNDDGVSMAPLLLMNNDKIFMETWYHLKDAVIEGGMPFNRAYGKNSFEYGAIDPRANKLFNQAMSQHSTLVMNKILETYTGFEGVDSLVDVGGGTGASINMILSKHPSIKGINFDLPHVIQYAPSNPGVKHIAGDMFVSVPRADAIFLKWICHDWSDAECFKILRNCYKALPENGKVIIAEHILSEIPNKALHSSVGFHADLIMLAYTPSGRERTEKEFQALAKASGFKQFLKVCSSFNLWIMEFHK